MSNTYLHNVFPHKSVFSERMYTHFRTQITQEKNKANEIKKGDIIFIYETGKIPSNSAHETKKAFGSKGRKSLIGAFKVTGKLEEENVHPDFGDKNLVWNYKMKVKAITPDDFKLIDIETVRKLLDSPRYSFRTPYLKLEGEVEKNFRKLLL